MYIYIYIFIMYIYHTYHMYIYICILYIYVDIIYVYIHIPKAKKKVINITIYRHRIPPKLSFHTFNNWERFKSDRLSETYLEKKSHTNIFQLQSLNLLYFSAPATLRSLRPTHFFEDLISLCQTIYWRPPVFYSAMQLLEDHEKLIESFLGLVRWRHINCSWCQSFSGSN